MTDGSLVVETTRKLADAIQRGVFVAGQRLPSERVLAEQYAVSRVTLRKALTRLATAGIVVASPQRGWLTVDSHTQEPPISLRSFTELAHQQGLVATAAVLERTVRPATLDEARRLRIPPAGDVLYLRRLRGMGGKVLCLDTSTIPMAIAAPLATADLTDASLYERLETLCRVTIHRSAYAVQAVAATADLAALLEIGVGAPILIGEDIAYRSDGSPVLLGLNYHRGDAYRFEADLFRRRA
ncbi:MAG: GntR family transcriptional regulator [Micrococcales bacterium]|nr:GntR family transcriptional regulator [Micrococcales bacterium]